MARQSTLNLPTDHFLNSFRGLNVFITGHTGFKGSWLTFLLKEVGANVTGYALPPDSDDSHFSLLGLDNKIKHIEADIRDLESLRSKIHECRPEVVFHLAAQALVKPSYEDPVTTIETNVLGSTNLLEAVRYCDSVRSLVYITSDKCYENVEWIWGYREHDQLGGLDPYSASKASAEILFSSYARSFLNNNPNLGAASTRAGNVIGGGDWAEARIVPDCIRAIQSDKPVVLRNPDATRPWQHVLEPLSGYLLLAHKLYREPVKWRGAWNFGPTSRIVRTVKEVAEILVKELGQGSVEIETTSDQVHEAQLLQLNCDKAHQLLNWYPRWDVDKTLQATATWYRQVLSGEDVENVTRSQIIEFYQETV